MMTTLAKTIHRRRRRRHQFYPLGVLCLEGIANKCRMKKQYLNYHLLLILLMIGNIETNPGPTRKLKCGSCQKLLGKSTRTRPLFYCTICGWVHFRCSGIKSRDEYSAKDFVCSKCSTQRVVSNALTENALLRKAHEAYTNLKKSPAAYGSIASLCKATGLSQKNVLEYLSTNSTYTKFHPSRSNFLRLKVQSYRINEIWSADLADMQNLSRENRGVRYLLVVVDTLSRVLHVEALKNKLADSCRQALNRIISRAKSRPEKIWTDDGKEFLGSFSKFCSQNNIVLYQTNNEKKSAYAERNIRSLKALIYRYLNENHTSNYIDHLQSFVRLINSRVNRVIKMAPKDVTSDHTSYLVSLNQNQRIIKPRFKIGDTVRIRRKIETFHHAYRIQFSHEIFRITKILTLNPPTYRVVAHETNEAILGRFYEAELVKFSNI